MGFFVQGSLRLENHGKSWFFWKNLPNRQRSAHLGTSVSVLNRFLTLQRHNLVHRKNMMNKIPPWRKKGLDTFLKNRKTQKYIILWKSRKLWKFWNFRDFRKFWFLKSFLVWIFSPWWRNCFHPDFHSTRKLFRMHREVPTRVGARNVDGLEVFFLSRNFHDFSSLRDPCTKKNPTFRWFHVH